MPLAERQDSHSPLGSLDECLGGLLERSTICALLRQPPSIASGQRRVLLFKKFQVISRPLELRSLEIEYRFALKWIIEIRSARKEEFSISKKGLRPLHRKIAVQLRRSGVYVLGLIPLVHSASD